MCTGVLVCVLVYLCTFIMHVLVCLCASFFMYWCIQYVRTGVLTGIRTCLYSRVFYVYMLCVYVLGRSVVDVFMCSCAYVCTCACVYVCLHVCMYVYFCMYACVKLIESKVLSSDMTSNKYYPLCVCKRMYVCDRVCTYVYDRVCTYVCM